MQKFRKKPVVVEAIKLTPSSYAECIKWIRANGGKAHAGKSPTTIVVGTLEDGDNEVSHVASVNDWIIKGVKGEFYPCKPDIFKETYESAE